MPPFPLGPTPKPPRPPSHATLAEAQGLLDRIAALWKTLPPNHRWRTAKYVTVVADIRELTDRLRVLLKESS
jgi:hypothetical protein